MRDDLEPLVRFAATLPRNGDLELSLLKCHLMIEEIITKLIEKHMSKKECLEEARLQFRQKVAVARGLCDFGKESWAWQAANKLNEARNALVHALDDKKTKNKVESFVAFVEQTKGSPSPEAISIAWGRFQWAVFQIFVVFSFHAHFDVSAFRLSAPTLLTGGSGADNT